MNSESVGKLQQVSGLTIPHNINLPAPDRAQRSDSHRLCSLLESSSQGLTREFYALLNVGRVALLAITVCCSMSAQGLDKPLATTAFTSSIANTAQPPGPAPEGMVWIPGGEFSMGSEGSLRESFCGLPGVTATRCPSTASMWTASGWTRPT